MHYQFEQDLEIGKTEQEKILKSLCENMGFSFVGGDQGTDWDFILKDKTNKIIPFEVKTDWIAYYTGNIAIEFSSRGKRSGIQITKSSFYIYRIFKEFTAQSSFKDLLIDVEKIKELILDEKYDSIVNGGDDGSDTLFYLFPIKFLIESGAAKAIKLT